EDLESVPAGHLHVEQHEVGALAVEELDRAVHVAGLARDDHVGDGGEQTPEPVARRLLVVHDRDAKAHAGRSRAGAAVGTWRGRTMRASAPRPAGEGRSSSAPRPRVVVAIRRLTLPSPWSSRMIPEGSPPKPRPSSSTSATSTPSETRARIRTVPPPG